MEKSNIKPRVRLGKRMSAEELRSLDRLYLPSHFFDVCHSTIENVSKYRPVWLQRLHEEAL